MSWNPKDDFYPDYSILEDIGNTTEQEKERIKNILREYNVIVSDENAKVYMELSRDIMLFLKTNCKDELQQFGDYLRREKYAGSTLPIVLILSQIVISEIIHLTLLGIKDIFKSQIKKLRDYLKKRKNKDNIIEQTEIVYKVLKKLEKNGSIVENLEFSIKKITNKK